jgi:regulator of protease activity HflC (stomatin/prohibitin superfamily)
MEIFIIGLLIIILIVVFCLKGVGKNQIIIVERWGKFYRKLTFGIYFLIPLMDRVVKRIPLLEQKKQLKISEHYVIIYYQIIEPEIYAYSAKRPIKELEKIIINLYKKANYLELSLLNEAIKYLGLKVNYLEKK